MNQELDKAAFMLQHFESENKKLNYVEVLLKSLSYLTNSDVKEHAFANRAIYSLIGTCASLYNDEYSDFKKQNFDEYFDDLTKDLDMNDPNYQDLKEIQEYYNTWRNLILSRLCTTDKLKLASIITDTATIYSLLGNNYYFGGCAAIVRICCDVTRGIRSYNKNYEERYAYNVLVNKIKSMN